MYIPKISQTDMTKIMKNITNSEYIPMYRYLSPKERAMKHITKSIVESNSRKAKYLDEFSKNNKIKLTYEKLNDDITIVKGEKTGWKGFVNKIKNALFGFQNEKSAVVTKYQDIYTATKEIQRAFNR